MEVGFAAGFDNWHVRIHDFVFRVRHFVDLRAARAVIVVPVADEQDLRVGKVKAKCLDALFDLRGRRVEIAVDEDVALWRGDQVGGQILAADVVEIARDVERRERRGPFRRVATAAPRSADDR